MQRKNLLGSLALVSAIVAGASGCVVRAHGHIGAPVAIVEVEEEPPPAARRDRGDPPGLRVHPGPVGSPR